MYLPQYYGVNLGGWLILERWITPSIFEGLSAGDENSFCLELGDQAAEKLRTHRKNFITEADIQWIKDHGLNAVRLPIPHWMFGGYEPFIGCQAEVDWLFEMAAKYEISVLLDLHTAPGSQNGWDHSGKAGEVGLTKSPGARGANLVGATASSRAVRWPNPTLSGLNF